MIILIADDDKLIRFSLKSMLLDIVAHDTRIAEVKNGKELVEQCGLIQPDIAFVDINMPYLNGVRAIEECKKTSPDTYFVVLTAYSDFSYAKQCIALQVFDYILKPIDPQKLSSLLQKLSKELSNSRQRRNSDFQLRLFNTFNLWDEIGISQYADDARSGSSSSEYLDYIFFIDCSHNPELYPQCYKNLLSGLKEIGSSFIRYGSVYGTLTSKGGTLRLIFEDATRLSGDISHRLNNLCVSLSKSQCLITCLCTGASNLLDIYQTFKKVEEQSYLRFLFSPSAVHQISSSAIQNLGSGLPFVKKMSDLMLAFLDADEERYENILSAFIKQYSALPPNVSLSSLSRYLFTFTGTRPNSSNLESFYTSLKGLTNQIQRTEEIPAASKIHKIQNYIAKNYMNDISITSLSDQFGLTPNYLSNLFHEKTGVKFIKYLTEVRISNAKRLLMQDEYISVKNLALMVGYTSPRHFSNLFQKYTGCYPSEFRKKFEEQHPCNPRSPSNLD